MNDYLLKYHCIKLRRFLALNIMSFSFQFLCIYHLHAAYPIYPIYPAMGIVYAVVALLGANALPGFIIGSFLAYYLKSFSLITNFLYSFADIGMAYMAVIFTDDLFDTDIPRLISRKTWQTFVIRMMTIAFFSGMLRCLGIILSLDHSIEFSKIVAIQFNLWLADGNAMILFYVFFSTWLSVYMSREPIATFKIRALHIFLFVILIASILFFMKNIDVIYPILLLMILTVVSAYKIGLTFASLLAYVTSMLFLAYCVVHQVYYLNYFELPGWCLLPFILFSMVFFMLMMGSD